MSGQTWDTRKEQDQWASIRANEDVQRFEAYRQSMANDPYVPSYHFYAPYSPNNINDPNGLCQWGSYFHLFYQAYPEGMHNVHWGHAISRDLVNWQDLPIAISPGPEEKCYSGAALVEADRVLAIYHGVGLGNMLAIADDPLLLDWEKLTDGAVIPKVDMDENGYPYRVFDPFIWKEADGYYALSGTFYGGSTKDVYGKQTMALPLFFSQNLTCWKYIGDLLPSNPYYGKGNDAACPYFWPLGDKHMLIHYSHASGPHCMVGDYDTKSHTFMPTQHVPLSGGNTGVGTLHAPSATPDGQGGCHVIFNVKDANPASARQGMMSVPRRFFLGEDQRLRMQPAEQLSNLRGAMQTFEGAALPANKPLYWPNVGNCTEIRLRMDIQQARALQIRVLCSEDRREHTDITIARRVRNKFLNDYDRMFLTLSALEASLLPEVLPNPLESQDAPVPSNDPIVEVAIFIDKCIVEVFVNDRLSLTHTVYPTLPDSNGLELTAIGNDAVLLEGCAWTMRGIYR